MKYMLLIYGDEHALSEKEIKGSDPLNLTKTALKMLGKAGAPLHDYAPFRKRQKKKITTKRLPTKHALASGEYAAWNVPAAPGSSNGNSKKDPSACK